MGAREIQHKTPGFGGLSTGERWVLALALVVMFCGGALRLAGIDQIGLKGSDNTYYTNIARHWSEGDRVLAIGDSHTTYRPVAYAVYAAAIRLFGYNDASIKTVNASLDTFNILLVFLLAFILSRRDPWAAASAAIIYSLLPFTILISRSELAHALSTSTILIALILLSLSWYAENRVARLVLALLSGVATGLSALTHEEMIFAAAAPALFLVLRSQKGSVGVRTRLIAATSHAGSYLFGVLLVTHGMLQTHQVEAQVRATGVIGYRISQAYYPRFVERPLKFGWNALTGSSSTLLACLVIILVLVLITRLVLHLKRRQAGWGLPRIPIEDLPLWTAAVYLLMYSFFFTYYAVRLFLPLIPMVIVWLIVRSASVSTQYVGRRASHGILAILTVTVVIANLGHIHTFRYSMSSHFETWTPFSPATDLSLGAGWSTFQESLTRTSWIRKLYEELGHTVTEDSRLLVGASTFHPYPGRRPLQIGYYFGDNAVHLFDHDQPLDQLIKEKKIAYVLFTSYQTDDRPAIEWGNWQRYRYEGRWGPLEPLTLGKSLGFAYGEYTTQGEFERLRANMARRGARIIFGRRDLLTKRPSVSDPVSFVVWVLDPKNWPPLDLEIQVTSRSLELASEGRMAKALAILEAAEAKTPKWGRFNLRLTGARILAEHDRPRKARQRVADSLALLPRNTTVATALSEAFPTQPATEEMYRLFTDLQATKPKDRALRDLLLSLALNLAEFAIEAEDRAGSINAFQTIERRLQTPGSRKLTLAIADWCAATGRDLAREGRSAEAEAALSAASIANR